MTSKIDFFKRLFDIKMHLTYTLPVLVLLSFVIVKMSAKQAANEKGLLQAKTSFDKWVNTKETDSFVHLSKLIQKQKSFAPEFDHLIVQQLLISDEVDKAEDFYGRVFERAKSSNSYYLDFAKTSIKICEGKYQIALEDALDLKQRLSNDEAFWKQDRELATYGANLFAFNLLRIASLYGEIGEKEMEFSSWDALSQYTLGEGVRPELQAFNDHTGINQGSFQEYLQFRKASYLSK